MSFKILSTNNSSWWIGKTSLPSLVHTWWCWFPSNKEYNFDKHLFSVVRSWEFDFEVTLFVFILIVDHHVGGFTFYIFIFNCYIPVYLWICVSLLWKYFRMVKLAIQKVARVARLSTQKLMLRNRDNLDMSSFQISAWANLRK